MLNYQTLAIDSLIVNILNERGELGFNRILSEIHTHQEKDKDKDSEKLSKKTLALHIKSLIEKDVICKKRGKTKKREIYTLSKNAKSYASESILTLKTQVRELKEITKKLDCYLQIDKARATKPC